MTQEEPLRHVMLTPQQVLYVSDAGCLVLASGLTECGDDFDQADEHVLIYPEVAESLVAAIRLLAPIAAAKEQAVSVAQEAAYRIAMGEPLPGESHD